MPFDAASAELEVMRGEDRAAVEEARRAQYFYVLHHIIIRAAVEKKGNERRAR